MVGTISTAAAGNREIRLFGPVEGAAGVRIIEQVGSGNLQTPTQAPIVVIGQFKRGPSGIPIFLSSRAQYDEIFGDKRDRRFALYANGEHLAPDVVDGFYAMGGDHAPLWVIRLDRENKGKRAKFTLKSPKGTPVLECWAANEGRWAGTSQELEQKTLIVVTSRTFTVHAPGVEVNEYQGAKAYFNERTGEGFEIVANTASFESGEVIFTVAPQHDLLGSGIHGPVALTGRSAYELTTAIDGTVAIPMHRDVPGQATLNGNVVTGTLTQFTRIPIGSNIYYQEEARVVESVTSDTTMTLSAPFTFEGTDITLQIDNLTVTGTGTPFNGAMVGHRMYVNVGGVTHDRTIAAVNSPTQVILDSGFPIDVPAGTSFRLDNFWVTGTGTNFALELQPGNSIVDPNRRGESVTVAEIDVVGQRFRVSQQFSAPFSNSHLTKQSQGVKVKLAQPKGMGLSVEAGLGTRLPLSHFSLRFYFNGSLVLRFPDVSLDPTDQYFVETLVNDGNVAHRSGQDVAQTYVTVKSLWNSAYTTAETNDIRPFNASGEMLLVTPRRIYTVADFDFEAAIGSTIHTNPYQQPGEIVRVVGGMAPVKTEGTISTAGAEVRGSATTFRRDFKRGDYLYDPISNTVRKVRLISSDTSMFLESAFPANVPPLTAAQKAGYIQVAEGLDLTTMVDGDGGRFVISFRENFKGGYDGDTGNLKPYYLTKFLNPDNNVIERALWGTGAGMWRMCCPGIHLAEVQRMGILYASRTASEFRVEIPPAYTPSMAESFINEDIGRSEFMSVAFPGYGWISDPLRGGQRLIPLTGDILGLETFHAQTNQGWHVPAAGVEARLSRFNEITYRVSPAEEGRLNNVGLQPIKKLYGSIVIFGAECPAIDEIYKFLHIRRSQSEMSRQFLEAMPFMRRLFKPNQPNTAEQLRMTLNAFAREMYRRGVFNQFLMFEQAVQITIESPTTQSANALDEANRDSIASLAGGNLTARMDWYPAGILKNLYIRLSPDIVTASYGS